MRSTDGAHYIALDHLRGIAALMVFIWHFTHSTDGYPVPFAFTPSPMLAPVALFDEGHTGVALFMTLSGYLFAKLLDGKRIRYGAFLWNRALRLLPLLVVVTAISTWQARRGGASGLQYLGGVAWGAIEPVLPNGGWSVTVECHFYVVLPLLLWLLRRRPWLPLILVAAALILRTLIYLKTGDMQGLGYWTIVGRIDQFVLGIVAFRGRHAIRGRHAVIVVVLAAFSLFYWAFDRAGGFYGIPHSPIWIVMPTIEGVAYAALIAWYDTSFTFSTRGVSKFFGLIGNYSYSIYLLHFYWVFFLARYIDQHLMRLSNFYVAVLWALLVFVGMLPVSYLSFRFIESPFLRLRRHYVVKQPATHSVHTAETAPDSVAGGEQPA